MKKFYLLVVCLFLLTGWGLSQNGLYIAQRGDVKIKSDAPLEIIKAESQSLKGVINPATKEFAFSIDINSFLGFNSEIQRTHFLEDYMEETKYTKATFKGKLIEDNLFLTPGIYTVRAKGILDMHGLQKERIIKGTLTIREGSINLEATFPVPLADHNIEIPKIVKQKIAEQIIVSINIEFDKNSKS